MIMTTKEIIAVERKELKEYIESIPYGDRSPFIKKVCEGCHLTRKHFYNWTAGLCRIPDACKAEMEKVAGKQIFSTI